VSNLKIQLQKEKDYSFFISEKLDTTDKEIEEYKLQIENFSFEVNRLKARVQEFQALSAAKSKKINDIEIEVYDIREGNMKLLEKVAKHKRRNKKAMYLLYLLHFKGYPVSELYENEIKDVAIEEIKSFDQDDSSADESVNEEFNQKRSVRLPASWKDIEPFMKLQKHWFDSDLHLDDFLFKSPTSSHIEPSSGRNSVKTEVYNQSMNTKEPRGSSNFREALLSSQKLDSLKSTNADHLASSISKFGDRKVRNSATFFNPLG